MSVGDDDLAVYLNDFTVLAHVACDGFVVDAIAQVIRDFCRLFDQLLRVFSGSAMEDVDVFVTGQRILQIITAIQQEAELVNLAGFEVIQFLEPERHSALVDTGCTGEAREPALTVYELDFNLFISACI